jgi:hypothetical protein
MEIFPAAVHHRKRRSTLGRILHLIVLDLGPKAYSLMVNPDKRRILLAPFGNRLQAPS